MDAVVVILVLMVLVGAAVAFGVHHRRQRSGGIIGVDRPNGPAEGRQG